MNAWLPGRRPPFLPKWRTTGNPDLRDDDFWEPLLDCWDYATVGIEGFESIYSACRYVFAKQLPGDVVECGVFFGGTVMFLAHLLKRHAQTRRTLYALDTFAGFVRRDPVRDVDWDGNPYGMPDDGPSFRRIAETNIRSVGWRAELVRIVEGDVAATVPALPAERIAILRLDTDTYDTTLLELEHLYPRVVRGGVVIVDDYGWGRGAREAVDEYFRYQPVHLNRVNRTIRSIVKLD